MKMLWKTLSKAALSVSLMLEHWLLTMLRRICRRIARSTRMIAVARTFRCSPGRWWVSIIGSEFWRSLMRVWRSVGWIERLICLSGVLAILRTIVAITVEFLRGWQGLASCCKVHVSSSFREGGVQIRWGVIRIDRSSPRVKEHVGTVAILQARFFQTCARSVCRFVVWSIPRRNALLRPSLRLLRRLAVVKISLSIGDASLALREIVVLRRRSMCPATWAVLNDWTAIILLFFRSAIRRMSIIRLVRIWRIAMTCPVLKGGCARDRFLRLNPCELSMLVYSFTGCSWAMRGMLWNTFRWLTDMLSSDTDYLLRLSVICFNWRRQLFVINENGIVSRVPFFTIEALSPSLRKRENL